jgi:hypothetical protein
MKLDYRQLEQPHGSEAPRPASAGQLDEVLVTDVRDGLTPADMVERKLLHLLEGSHARLGDAETSVTRMPGHQRPVFSYRPNAASRSNTLCE